MPVSLELAEAGLRLYYAGSGHLKAMEASRQRFTLRATRRMVPYMFSMAFVQASERRSSGANRSRLTVRIFIEIFEQAGRDARRLALHALGEVPDDAFGFGSVIQLPSGAH